MSKSFNTNTPGSQNIDLNNMYEIDNVRVIQEHETRPDSQQNTHIVFDDFRMLALSAAELPDENWNN